MPEPPPPPPGFVAPPEPRHPEVREPQPPRQEYRQRLYHRPVAPPSHAMSYPPPRWTPVPNVPVPYQFDASILQSSSWRQSPQRSTAVPYVSTVIPIPPLTQQPQRNTMIQSQPAQKHSNYDRRFPDIEMEWLKPEVPNGIFGLIGETLLCPLKITLYILGELFRKVA
jgi:hypothetical protein